MGFGEWTLSLSKSTDALRETIATALSWHVDPDSFLQLASSDPQVVLNQDWADMLVLVRDPSRHDYYNLLEILPGCRLAEKQPDLGGSNAGPRLELHDGNVVPGGSWCDEGKFWIDASWADGDRLHELFERVRVVTSETSGD